MKRALVTSVLVFVAGCGTPDVVDPGESPSASIHSEADPVLAPTDADPASTSNVRETAASTSAAVVPDSLPTIPSASEADTTVPPTAGPTTAPAIPPAPVTSPGAYAETELAIHLAFESLVDDFTTEWFASEAMEILTAPTGWARSGFTFVSDPTSDLRVVLAEGATVDELCLPLETHGTVNCQNGPVVAINADRWREGGRDWDSTVAAYRSYVVNHEVGHLIGLRHPVERCPTPERISAVMEPQTNNLGRCSGNGVPLDWEVAWALGRPIVVGPAPDWDGPRPQWPMP